MIKPLTIQELYESLAYQIQQGNGSKYAIITDDDECNGFHPVWNGAANMDEWDIDVLRICHLHGMTKEFVKEKCALIW